MHDWAGRLLSFSFVSGNPATSHYSFACHAGEEAATTGYDETRCRVYGYWGTQTQLSFALAHTTRSSPSVKYDTSSAT